MPAYPHETHHHDVVVIGAGGAGLRAACAAAEKGASVACLSKVPPTRSHTVAAQGGINAALGNRLPDAWQWHMYDTIRGGDWLGDQDAIAYMCERAPATIREMEHMGLPFTRDKHGLIYQRAYGGQYSDYGKGGLAYRACAVADRTGHALLHTLYGQAKKHGVHFAVECMALDLIFDQTNTCRGVLAWQLETGTLRLFRAHTVILATGGYGQAWAATTSSSICTGDGGGMALRAGLPLQDMEFVQFHPTSLYGTGVLITEGARGEGAVLKNARGERFMQHYAEHSMELASRDVIARAMAQEIAEGRGCGDKRDHLHLCLDHLDPNIVRAQLPSVISIAQTFARIDATHQPIPVLPAVHYTMGGIASNARSEVLNETGTPVPGLLAIGEAACNSIHGANRLGCNSLLDLVVFGQSAGERAAKTKGAHAPLSASALDSAFAQLDRFRNAKGELRPSALRKQIQSAMHEHAAIFRSEASLAAGEEKLRETWSNLQHNLYIGDRSLLWNNDLLEAYEADNLLRQALVTIASARTRLESRGAHWRHDFPARNDEQWLAHTLASLDAAGNVRLTRREVRTNAESLSFPPEARIY